MSNTSAREAGMGAVDPLMMSWNGKCHTVLAPSIQGADYAMVSPVPLIMPIVVCEVFQALVRSVDGTTSPD